MKLIINRIYIFFLKKIFVLKSCFYRGVIRENGWAIKSQFFIEKKNLIKFNKGTTIKTLFTIVGSNNEVILNSDLKHSEIRVHGENNRIIIEGNCKINKTTIVVRGSNCIVHIHCGTSVGSLYLVCMGVANKVIIGEDCMIADNVEIWSSDTHPIYNINRNIINISKPINIENHVWIGKEAVILKGVSIGENSVIGMRALVTHSYGSGALIVGSPASCIKRDINWDRSFITQ